ncbi:MAG TPA: glycoside hydrolase family 38 C-terminal domain-containing protein [Polyangiaceae bacterium]
MSDTIERGEFQRLRGRYAGYTRTRLKQFARRLRRAIYPERVKVERIELAGTTERISYAEATALKYRDVGLGEPLGPLWSTYWARVTVRVPEGWHGARVDLYWDSRSEALLWLDGRSSQGLNIGRYTATLAQKAKGGETITLYMEIACNRAFGANEAGHPAREPYALDACELRRFDPEAWSLFHDFDVLRQLEADREPPQTPKSTGGVAPRIVRPALDTTWAGKLLHELNEAVNVIDPEDPATWSAGRAILRKLLGATNGAVTHELSAIGHAHIDTAWLWPIEETRRKCQRSFANVLALMDEYPEFKFACSQAAQYVMIEEDNPELFARIKAKVANGQWIPIGGSWVEPDCNLPSGEAIARQFLYGQRYFEKTFGARARIFWNPDVFGYAGQLPQLMREAGMDRFLTQKLSWNRFTAPPHHSFFWRGLDGSEVLTHFPPVDTYNGMATCEELRYHAANYKDADRSAQALYLFGYGDGGGGPDADMIESLRRTKDLLGVPRSETRDPNAFFDRLEREAHNLATVEGELYFEYHRGTYTSQSEVKRLNRLIEGRLQDLEYLCTAAALAKIATPSRSEIETLWRVLLTNQFHDILPGSSIGEVYERTRPELCETAEAAAGAAQSLLDALASGGAATPVNPIGFARDELAAAPDGALCRVVAEPFAAGRIEDARDRVRLEDGPDGIVLANAALVATLSRGGSVLSLVHKASGREALAAPANRFVLFDDRPTEYEAWDIDPFALETGRETPAAERCEIVSRGPLRAELRFERRIGKTSRMTQTVRLDAGAARLEFDTEIDWNERRKLLKAVFPLAAQAPRATYETMCGAVERPTHANTDADLAQYEVPGHRWADLSEPAFGVSLLTDSRYGYATFGSVMSLSLLRGTMSPDPGGDLGVHRLRYALYPHAGDWRAGGTVAEALRFNRPLLWTNGAAHAVLAKPLAAADNEAVVIDTIKPAEDGKGWVVRLYESQGSAVRTRLRFGVNVRRAQLSNTLEDDGETLPLEGNGLTLTLRPFQIATLRVE